MYITGRTLFFVTSALESGGGGSVILHRSATDKNYKV